MTMQRKRQLPCIVVIGILWFQILLPRCSAAKTLGVSDNLLGRTSPEQMQHRQKHKSSSVDDPERVVEMVLRCRHGYFHVVNNDYTHWEMYAIGGSAKPTINSEGNRYLAPSDTNAKQVTMRLDADDGEWMHWNWRTEGDQMLNGAYFVPSGAGAAESYMLASSLGAKPAFLVGALTGHAGVLQDGVTSESGSGSIGSGNGNKAISGSTGVGGSVTVSGAETLSPFPCKMYYVTLCVCLMLRLDEVLEFLNFAG